MSNSNITFKSTTTLPFCLIDIQYITDSVGFCNKVNTVSVSLNCRCVDNRVYSLWFMWMSGQLQEGCWLADHLLPMPRPAARTQAAAAAHRGGSESSNRDLRGGLQIRAIALETMSSNHDNPELVSFDQSTQMPFKRRVWSWVLHTDK